MFIVKQSGNFLVLESADEALRSPGPYPLRGKLSLGSADYCDIQVFNRQLSPAHARFRLEGEMVLLDDLSGGGSYVNGIAVQSSPLKVGDQIQFRAVAPKVEEEVDRTEISREEVPWAPVEQFLDLCTDDKSQWISPTLKLSGDQTANHEVRLQALLGITTALSRPQTLDQALQRVTDFVLQTMNIDRATLFLVETQPGGRREFTYRAQSSKSGKPSDEPSRTVTRKVMETEQGVLIRDARLDNKTAQSASIRIQNIRTCICLPLKTPQNFLGILYADANRPNILNDKEDVQFFSAFASLAAVAVENSLLLRRVEKQVAERARYQRFFPPQAVEHLMETDSLLSGREQNVTILFCDIRNYTALSALRSAREVADLLNHYFKTLVPIIFSHHGTLEKFIGDALVAIWGAPLEIPAEEQVAWALEASLKIQQGISKLNQRVSGLNLEVGIGVHHGPAYVGALGDDSYLQYAAVGSTTNLSARICSHALAHQVLMSKESLAALQRGCQHHQPELSQMCRKLLDSVQPVGRFAAKGFSEEVEIYQVGVATPSGV